MGSGFEAGGWGPVAIKKWRMPAPVPTFGPNLLANGDMESGDPPTDWVAGANTQLASVVDARPGSAGTKSMQMMASASATTLSATQTFSANVGDWIRITGWWNRGTSNNGSNASPYTAFHNYFTGGHKLIAGWQALMPFTGRISTLPTSLFVSTKNTPAASGYSGFYDDLAVENPTVSCGVYRLKQSFPGVEVFVPSQAGLISRLDDTANPLNFVLAYFWGGTNKIAVDKCVNGVYTNLISDTTTRTNGSQLSISWSGNVTTVYCNGVQVGTPQTIADASIVGNVHHGLFSTYEGGSFSGFQITP